jgi:hypothetical protein
MGAPGTFVVVKDNNMGSRWSNGMGVVIKVAIDLSPSREVGVDAASSE